MITLTVTSFKGAAVSNMAASFDELGGTIGRADTNQLVLPDPERAISRVQAQIAFRNGAYALIGHGGNPVLHNGRPVGHGSEVMLAEGDQLDIGAYHAVVSMQQAVSAPDPFAAAFGTSTKMATAGPLLRKMAAQASPFDARPAPVSPTPSPAGQGSFGIPDDWDPFAPEPQADPFGKPPSPAAGGFQSAPAPTARPGTPELAALRPAQEDSIDALFGLGGGKASADPFASSPLAAAVAQPNTSANADPLRALQQLPQSDFMADSDHVSDLNAPWVSQRPAAKVQSGAPAAALPGAVLSWDTPSRESKSVGHVSPATVMAARPAPAAQTPVAPSPIAAAAPAAVAATPGRDVELLQALLEGLGTPDLRVAGMSPELMRLVGQLLRESTKGTVELLGARSALKREVRANVTMIIASENNSLKFSPTADVALQYMLGPRMHGFMPPVESMRDAYDDLKAHQLGVMAGMKAALTGVLNRFDPSVVEGKLTSRSALSSLLPSSRKARLWEMFQELYQQLATEAEEDFNNLFGAAFLRAYEQHIKQLRDPGPKE